jgi:hypothetical protein
MLDPGLQEGLAGDLVAGGPVEADRVGLGVQDDPVRAGGASDVARTPQEGAAHSLAPERRCYGHAPELRGLLLEEQAARSYDLASGDGHEVGRLVVAAVHVLPPWDPLLSDEDAFAQGKRRAALRAPARGPDLDHRRSA